MTHNPNASPVGRAARCDGIQCFRLSFTCADGPTHRPKPLCEEGWRGFAPKMIDWPLNRGNIAGPTMKSRPTPFSSVSARSDRGQPEEAGAQPPGSGDREE